jgi:regulator of sigma E protease
MTWISGIFGALIAVVVLVVVHEFGHFLAAKIFRVGVPVFSVGMGPRVAGFFWKGTDYRLSALPIGGYVQLAGADPFGEEDFEAPRLPPEQDFMQKPVWQRLIVMLAGPVANLILPVVIFTLLFMGGYPEFRSEIGLVSYDSPAWRAGIRSGDVVVAVDDEPVRVWRDLESALARRVDQDIPLIVERGGERVALTLPAGSFARRARTMLDSDSLGIEPGRRSSRIGVSDPASPAGVAGVRTFDAITAVDGQKVEDYRALLDALEGDRHLLTVLRADPETGERTTLQLPVARTDWAPPVDDPSPNPWGLAPVDLFVGGLLEGQPADAAGIKTGDRLYAVDGVVVYDFGHLKAQVATSAVDPLDYSAGTRPITLTVIRDGARVESAFSPKLIDATTVYGTRYTPLMGIRMTPDARIFPERTLKYYNPVQAFAMGVERTWNAVETVLTALDSMLRMRTNPSKMMGGPLAIFSVTGQSLMLGVHAYAGTIAAISVSLAIVNLLPVPALDGGQIIVYLIEWIRGRPLSAEVRVRIQMFGVLILFALIILVTISDVRNVFFPEF